MNGYDTFRECKHLSIKSNCDKIRFGAIVTDSMGQAIGWGYNHNPIADEEWECAKECAGSIRLGVRGGTCVERCYSIHAEQHALLDSGGKGKTMWVAGWMPDGTPFDNGGGFYCTVCARLMMVAGIEYVMIRSNDEWKLLTMQEAWDDSYRLATKTQSCH